MGTKPQCNAIVHFPSTSADLKDTPVGPPLPHNLIEGTRPPKPHGRVTVHLQNIGDKQYSFGQWAGTKGNHRRLEGFKIDVDGDINLEYMAHIQELGNTPWTSGYVGTLGESLQLEGFAIRVKGEDSHKWSVHYRAHLQNIGDTRIMKDGEFCGTKGQKRRVEAIWVDLVFKG